MDEVLHVEKSENGIYELGFLLVPGITEEKLAEVFGEIKNVTSDLGGVVFAEEFPKMITLAYTMEKTINNKIERFKEGWFGWVKFEMVSGNVNTLDAKMRLRVDVIRHLLISTVRENTVASKRVPGNRRTVTKGDEKESGVPEMSKEEIDREIEALVTDKAPEAVVEAEKEV
ncbi:MAG: 30S ribosomal protein S6 [bacterium]